MSINPAVPPTVICHTRGKSGSAADRLLNRARDALARTDGVVWRDKDRVMQAFTIAATTLGI